MSDLEQQLQITLGDTYRLEGELGGGGMSRVFVAHETALGRKVVIKVLLPELSAGVSVDRFRREIQIAAQLQHPHIVPLLSAGESNGLPYFVMPFVVGESLRARVARSGELPIAEAVRILRDVISALAYAHEYGVVHRDIKPDNVLISGGVAVVTDFGVAKAFSASSGGDTSTALTSLGLALGTPAYMAPEQASGDAQLDHRADIYALGVMAYEMLTGRTPFLGRSPQAILSAHVLEMPDPVERLRPAIPPMLASLVMHCLAKRAADRPQAASDMLHALDAIATPVSGTTPTTVVSVPAIKAEQPRKGRGGVLAAAGVAAALVVGVMLWIRHESSTPVSGLAGVASAHPDTLGAAPALAPARPPPPAPLDTSPAAPVEKQPLPRAERQAPAPARVTAPPRVERPPSEKKPEAVARDIRDRVRESPADSARPEPVSAPPTVPEKQAPAPLQGQPPSPPAAPGTPDSSVPPPTPEPGQAGVAPAPAAPALAPAPPAAPAPPPPDNQAQMRGVVEVIEQYARAVESESVENLKRVYPGMTSEQQAGWGQFFGTVRDVKSQLNVQRADISGDVGSVLVTGSYTYVNGSTRRTEQQQVSFRAIMRRSGGVWRMSEVH